MSLWKGYDEAASRISIIIIYWRVLRWTALIQQLMCCTLVSLNLCRCMCRTSHRSTNVSVSFQFAIIFGMQTVCVLCKNCDMEIGNGREIFFYNSVTRHGVSCPMTLTATYLRVMELERHRFRRFINSCYNLFLCFWLNFFVDKLPFLWLRGDWE